MISNTEKCSSCGNDILVLQYRDEGGWRCDHCSPPTRACKNQFQGFRYLFCGQGCQYTDFDKKCETHEAFFCELRTSCQICEEVVTSGCFAEHYATACKADRYSNGSTWKTERAYGRNCLVACPAGTVVCSNWLVGFEYQLCVYTSLQSERLKEFRCTVRIKEYCTGRELTFTPDVVYIDSMDWYLKVTMKDFGGWCQELDVSVDIAKIE